MQATHGRGRGRTGGFSPSNRSGAFDWVFWLVSGGVVTLLLALLLPATSRSSRPAARRSQCKNNLKQIGLALHNYHDKYGAFPPAYTVDRYGNRLHSWRTLILPFLDQRPLYNTIDLEKPWDDPANAEAGKVRLATYECPSQSGTPENHTLYLANAAQGGLLQAGKPREISEIVDGTSQTLMIIEAPLDRSVHWMSPFDADESLILSVGSDSKATHTHGAHAALCDGSVRFLPSNLSAETRRALMTIAGHDVPGEF